MRLRGACTRGTCGGAGHGAGGGAFALRRGGAAARTWPSAERKLPGAQPSRAELGRRTRAQPSGESEDDEEAVPAHEPQLGPRVVWERLLARRRVGVQCHGRDLAESARRALLPRSVAARRLPGRQPPARARACPPTRRSATIGAGTRGGAVAYAAAAGRLMCWAWAGQTGAAERTERALLHAPGR